MVEHRPPARDRKGPFRVLVEDETGDVELVFFLANIEWMKKRLPVGATRWVSGKLELWDGHLQMVHPDRSWTNARIAKMPAVEPVYGLTEGLYPRTSRRPREAALARLPALPEWIDAATLLAPSRRLPSPRRSAACMSPSAPRRHRPDEPGGEAPRL